MTEFDKIRDVIVAQMGAGGKITKDMIKPETAFVEDLGADSLDIFQIITELEEIYDMEFGDDDADKIKTVGDAAAYVQKALAR